MKKNILDYNFPQDLKSMSDEELELLSYSIREFLIDKVSKTGGHLASNLGVVELSIALHKVFDSPRDKIIWDVGHQSYIHKILTGRAGEFDSLRQFKGLSGFPKEKESPHDAFDTGHSSTSVAAAAGMARAREIKGEDYEVVAVIGDGSLTGGMAYEAMNNIGASKSKVIVILNDNGMSISKNIGGISTHLGTLRTSKGYLSAKRFIKKTIGSRGSVGSAIAGGLAGMGAAMLFLTGFEQWQCTQSSIPGMGFNGIAAAFLGGLNPLGTILSSYFIQHITNGGAYVDKTMYSAQISAFISALIISLCGFVLFFKYALNRRLDRLDEKKAAKEGGKTE